MQTGAKIAEHWSLLGGDEGPVGQDRFEMPAGVNPLLGEDINLQTGGIDPNQNEKETSEPANHTTSALLKCQPILALIRDNLEVGQVVHVHDFPTCEEERRGHLQVWGRGEGSKSTDGDLLNPPLPPASFVERLVRGYVRSYKNNIQNMHLLIIPDELSIMVSQFLRTASPNSPEFMTINNAVVLLVLALGEVCLHNWGIPDVALPGETEHGRQSLYQPSWTNIDVVHGLGYFACATRILATHLSGTSIQHIHANLLAALYYGRLVRPLESWVYIRRAGHALQHWIQRNLERIKRQKTRVSETMDEDNQHLFAFWTCVDLERDVTIEFQYPPSGILEYEEVMPRPNVHWGREKGFGTSALQAYLAHLYLRKTVNQISSGALGVSIGEGFLGTHFLPPGFQFNRNDPPSTDILSARLRAEHSWAHVIIYWPRVHQILELNFNQPESDRPLDSKTIEHAAKGIQALIDNSRAFHGLPERFIVTDVFKTAHTQWGNLLMLSAVFKDPTLGGFVDKDILRYLFSWTIAFFKATAHCTSALHIELRMLEDLERKVFGARSGELGTIFPVRTVGR